MNVSAFLLVLSCGALTAADTDWRTYGGNMSGWRFSELNQITADNVAALTPKWIFQTGAPGHMEATPLVIDGLKYVPAASNHAFAIDLRTG